MDKADKTDKANDEEVDKAEAEKEEVDEEGTADAGGWLMRGL